MFSGVKREEKAGRSVLRRHWTFQLVNGPTDSIIILSEFSVTNITPSGKEKVIEQWDRTTTVKGKLVKEPGVPPDVGQEGVNKLVELIRIAFKVSSKR
jgi:hypothetical protein